LGASRGRQTATAGFASGQHGAVYLPGIATIGERIRSRRIALGLSLREVARPGLSPGYVSRLERGERQASMKALRLLAPVLECSAHWLETGRDDPAELLAQLVLEHRGQPLPKQAATLARQVLIATRE
jgi:transcriptional regulator with XRE-family HTH domain